MPARDGIPDKNHALRDRLIEEIRNGRQPPGTRLPSEWALARTWQVSRTTVRAALSDLARLGVISRGQGRGTFVHEDADRILGLNQAPALRVALVMPTDRINNAIFHDVLVAFQEHLDPRVRPAFFFHDAPRPGRYREVGADIVVIDGRYDAREVDQLRALHQRVVVLNRIHDDLPFLCTDNMYGGELMASHAVDLGHRDIGLLALGADPLEQEFHHRRGGVLRILAQAGITPTERHLDVHAMERYTAREATRDLLKAAPRCTAILCLMDVLAMQAMEYLEEHDIRVPDRIGIIGYDDVAAARLCDPPLTTVRQPATELGRALADHVNGHLDGRSVRLDHPLLPQLVQRGSIRHRDAMSDHQTR